MTRRICGVLVIAMMVAIPVGCGSDNKAPTKAEFVKKGNAICKAGNAKIKLAGKKVFKGKPTSQQLNAFATKVLIPNVQAQVTAIKNMTPPKGDESKVKAIVDSAQKGLDKGKVNPALLTQNGPGPFARSNKLTTAYGLTVCGQG